MTKDKAIEFLAAEVEKYEGKHPVEGGYCPVRAALDAISAAYDAGRLAEAQCSEF